MAYQYSEYVWVAVGIVWLIASIAAKRAVRTEASSSRLTHMAVMAAAFALLFWGRFGFGVLGWRFVPDMPAIAWTGFGITVAGAAFAIWARLILAGNWSASVTVKQDHRLVRKGPYTLVRHPIYTGFLLALLGTAVALGEVRGLLGVALAFAGWRSKSLIEESFMTQEFGVEYTNYQREVKALIPFVL